MNLLLEWGLKFTHLKEKIKTRYLYKKINIILCTNKGLILLTNQGAQGMIEP